MKAERQLCWNCHRARVVCLCGRIKPFELEPLLVVLIHPKENKKTIGTARLVKLSVSNSLFRIGHGHEFDEDPEFQRIAADPSLFPVVLFPGPESFNLSRASKAEVCDWVPAGRRLVIFVIDGSWSLAKKMIRTSRLLRELPRVSFDVKTPSGYQFRRQPREYCLSTVEAVHLLIESLHACGLHERPAENIHSVMLETFSWLVDDQLRRQREKAAAEAR